MMKVLNCLVVDHDPKLVLLAAALCFLTSCGAVVLLQRARASTGISRRIWLVVAAGSAGYGVWSTHFVAMLAYDADVVMGFQVGLTLLSLLMAVLMTFVGMLLATRVRARRIMTFAGALCFAAGVSGMHFVGMSALELPGRIQWDPQLVAASLVFAVVFSTAAFFSTDHKACTTLRRTLMPALLLTLAIVSLHFTAMGAVTVGDGPIPEHSGALASPGLLSVMITTIAVSLLCAGIVIAGFAQRAQRDRAENARQLSLLVSGVTDYAIYMLDPTGRVTSWNAGAERLKGYTADEVIGRSFALFHSREEQLRGDPARSLEQALLNHGVEREGWRYRKDGTTFWANVVIDPIRDEDGRHIGFAKITRDQTRQKAAAEELAHVTANLDVAIENISQGICLFDPEERLVLSNRRVREIFGGEHDLQLVGLTYRELLTAIYTLRAHPSSDIAAAVEQTYRLHILPLKATGMSDVVVKSQSGRSVSVKYRAIPGGGWVSTYEDITQRVESEEQIAFLARHDGLTGLPNRVEFRARLDAAVVKAKQSGTKLAVLAIDVDGFREINDMHGDIGGDRVLTLLAGMFSELAGEADVVARLGGDEFAIVHPFRRTPRARRVPRPRRGRQQQPRRWCRYGDQHHLQPRRCHLSAGCDRRRAAAQQCRSRAEPGKGRAQSQHLLL